MPPRKSDPFNFDDVFIAAGAEGLVKKTMGEMKRASAAAAPSGSAVPPKLGGGTAPGRAAGGSLGAAPGPVHSQPAPKTAVQLPPGSLDFLAGGPSASSKTTASQAAKPIKQAAGGAWGGGGDAFLDGLGAPFGSGATSTAAPPPASGSSADPFSMFDDLPGAQPAQAAIQAPSAAADDHFAGFEDIASAPAVASAPLTTASSSPKSVVMPKPLGGSAPHLAGLHNGLASDDYTGAAQPPLTSAAMPHVSSSGALGGGRPAALSTAAGAARFSSPSNLPASVSPGSGSSLGGDTQALYRLPRPRAQPQTQSQQQQHDVRPGSYDDSHDDDSKRYDDWKPAARSDGVYLEGRRGAYESSAPVPSRQQGAAGGGVVGMLKGLGKKAVKVAQAGLQTLETALERIDGVGAVPNSVSQGSSGGGAQPARHASPSAYDSGYDRPGSPNGARRYDRTEHDSTAAQEEPENVALALLALPPGERGEVLATLPPAQRRAVQRVLDQLTEGEEAAENERRRDGRSSRATPLAVDIRTSEVDFSSWDAPPPPQPAVLPKARPAATAAPKQDASPPPHPPAPARAPQPADHDLLGMTPTAQQPQAVPSVYAGGSDDLLGMGSPSGVTAAAPRPAGVEHARKPSSGVDHPPLGAGFDSGPAPAPAPPPVPAPAPPPAPAAGHQVGDVDDMHDFFSGGSAPAPAAPPAAPPAAVAPSQPARTAARATPPAPIRPPARSAPKPAAALMDLTDALDAPDVDTTAHADLYRDTEAEEGEPELRKQLRAARLAEQHAKMRGALAAKLAAEQEEARQREEQVALKSQLGTQVETWKNKNKGNIRGLLSSLQNVMWEGSGWVPLGMGDLLEPGQIRKAWMKANLLVHPDKVRQRNGPPEQVARADMIFDVLKDAWNAFQTTGK